MEILTSKLPSGGYGYPFPSVKINPMTFREVVGYTENCPSDPLSKYLFDIDHVIKDDPITEKCYVMDMDYLIFAKKLLTVSQDLSFSITVTCPNCGKKIDKKVYIQDLEYTAVDPNIMEGGYIELFHNKYEYEVPTIEKFMSVFSNYLRCRTLDNLDLIKLISMLKEFHVYPNRVENLVLNAKYDDISALLALKELYIDKVKPIEVHCPVCDKKKERRSMTVSANGLIVDFFREIIKYNPISSTKIQFKQIRKD